MEYLGDIAARVATELRDKHVGEIERGEREIDLERRIMAHEGQGLMSKVEFRWRDSDKLILDQIRAAGRAIFEREFEDAIAVLDSLYGRLRMPEVNEYGIVRTDVNGRAIWQRDERGRIVERWDNLTGQDFEKASFDLQRLQFGLSVRVNELQAEALFARHLHDDEHHEAYSAVVDGTVRDREARASREAREAKYLSFFKYVIWSGADSFMAEIKNFQRLVEKTVSWGAWRAEQK